MEDKKENKAESKTEKDAFSPLTCSPVILCPPINASALLRENYTLVCLIRHGQTDWNAVMRLQGRECVPLNDIGRCQAKNCAETLRDAKESGFCPTKVFSSPLSRAKETADLIAKRLGLGDTLTEEMLIERNYGELSGLTLEERRLKFPRGERQASGVESVSEAAFRMKRAMRKLAISSRRETVIAVTHGGVLNALFIRITRGKVGTGKNISPNCGISLVAASRIATVPLAYGLKDEAFLEYIREMGTQGKEHS